MDHPTPAKAPTHRPGETRLPESAKRAERRARAKRKDEDAGDGPVVKNAKTNRNFFHPDAVKQLRSEGKPATATNVAHLWNRMSEEERAPYNALAVEDRTRYYNETEAGLSHQSTLSTP